MIKNLILGLVAMTLLTACDDWWEGISNSGSGSEQPTETQLASLPAATTSSGSSGETSDSGDAESGTSAAATENNDSPEEATASSSESKTVAEPDLPEIAAAETSSRSDECGVGKYGFVTTKDNDTHFHAYFDSGGRVRYLLNGSPTGKWSLEGDRMDVYGPFKMPGRKYTTLNFTVTSRASDCKVREALGKSPGGQDLAIRRR